MPQQRSVLKHAEFKCLLAGSSLATHTSHSTTPCPVVICLIPLFMLPAQLLRSSEFATPFMLMTFQGLEPDLEKKTKGELGGLGRHPREMPNGCGWCHSGDGGGSPVLRSPLMRPGTERSPSRSSVLAPRQMCGPPGTAGGGLEADVACFDSQRCDLATLCTQANPSRTGSLTISFGLAHEPVVGLQPRCRLSNQYQPPCLSGLHWFSPVTHVEA